VEQHNTEKTRVHKGESDQQVEGGENMEMCPMASMCKGMMGKRGAGYLLMVPGAVLVLVGILILIEPTILYWLMAGTSILIGIIMFVFANFMRKMSKG